MNLSYPTVIPGQQALAGPGTAGRVAGAPRGPGPFNEQNPAKHFPVTRGLDFLGFNLLPPLTPTAMAADQAGRQRPSRGFREEACEGVSAPPSRGATSQSGTGEIGPYSHGCLGVPPTYRTVVSTRVVRLPLETYYLWKLTYKWHAWSHPNKAERWIQPPDFGKFQ